MGRLAAILHFPLFGIGGQAITPVRLLILTLIFLITFYVARATRRQTERRLIRYLEAGPRYTVARLSQYAVWAIGLILALSLVNIDLTAFAVVAGALGLGVGFGLQNVVANFVAGLVLLFERPIKIQDRVTVENIEGNVLEINFRTTTLRTNDNITIIVPNSEFINRSVINWSHGDPRVRIHVPVGVAYGSNVELVTQTLLEVAFGMEGVLRDPPPTVRFTEFGDSSLNFELLVWTDQPTRHPLLRSNLNYATDAAFRLHGIQIPFPQRDVHIKSAAVRAGIPPVT
jgi:small-conductance mechanosensitive channel